MDLWSQETGQWEFAALQFFCLLCSTPSSSLVEQAFECTTLQRQLTVTHVPVPFS